VQLEYVIQFLIRHVPIIVTIYLFDNFHYILQFIIFHYYVEQLRFADGCQNLLFTIEETQVAAVIYHVRVVGLLIHVHSVIELAKFHLHTHLTQSADVHQNVLTVRICHKGLHESISVIFRVDSYVEIVKDLKQLIIRNDVIIVFFNLLINSGNKFLPILANSFRYG